MKKGTLLIAAMLMIGCALNSIKAQNFSQACLNFRSSVFNYLKNEGFQPNIDSDGDIQFKREGNTFWIQVRDDSSPFYITVMSSPMNCENAGYRDVMEAINTANDRIRCAKASKKNDKIWFTVETYAATATEFNKLIYKYLNAIEASEKKVKDVYND